MTFDPMAPFRKLKGKHHDKHDTYRDVLTFDAENWRYRIDRTTIRRDEVRPKDLKMSQAKYHYFYTELKPPEWKATRKEIDEDGVEHEYLNPTASSDFLYMESNALHDALFGEFRAKVLNPLVLAGLVVGGVVLILFFVLGR